MQITAMDVKQLRLETGAGYMDAKRALEQAGGDPQRAVLALREKGVAIAQKKTGRVAAEGRIEVYGHTGDRVGVMLELNCETDFAAATERFRALAHNLALHIAAMNPAYISAAEVPAEVVARERAVYEAQARSERKPEKIAAAIAEGRLQKFYQTECLLEQPYIRDGSRSVRDELTACVAALQENITVKRFVRYELGNR
jgi:elongation factor Ts